MIQAAPRLSDREAIIFDALSIAAEAGEVCPTQDHLLMLLESFGHDSAGLSSTVNIMQRLERKGLIEVARFQRSRQVRIVGSGKMTAEPKNKAPHWRDRPRDVPTPSLNEVRRRAPTLTEQIIQRAARLNKPVVEYLADLVFVGWEVERERI